jgi:uncharacterized membrane protein YdbT with pleckstrin-like domain
MTIKQPEISPYVRKLLGNDEQVVFMTRKHVIVIARALLVGLFAVIVIAAGAIFAGAMTQGLGYLLLILLLLPLWQIAVTITRWRNEEYLVSNRRVMKIEGVLSKHVFDSSLEKVNDVELDQSWFGRMLNYGDVDILTGNVGGVNKFLQIAAPVEFKRQMLDQKEAMGTVSDFGAREKRVLETSTQAKGDIPELIAELDELRKKGVINDADFEAKKADLLKRM